MWVARHGGKKKLVSDEGTQEGQRETRQTDTTRITGVKRQSKTRMCPPDFNYLRQSWLVIPFHEHLLQLHSFLLVFSFYFIHVPSLRDGVAYFQEKYPPSPR